MKKSLLSLLAVVALVATLQNFLKPSQEDLANDCRVNLKTIAVASSIYATDWAGNHPENRELLVPNYLPEVPVCPTAELNTYLHEVSPILDGEDDYPRGFIELGPGDLVQRNNCISTRHTPPWAEEVKLVWWP